jgi:uncharacterized protein (TIGR03083 family)
MSDQFNAFNPASKETLLGLVRREAADFLALAEETGRWEAPTACSNWQVRDVVGHMIDATEGYFPGWERARGGGGDNPEPLGLQGMMERNDERARAMRELPQADVVARLRQDYARAMEFYESLSDDEWTNLMCFHPSMGPLPASLYPTFQLADYGVHNWDLREGLGRPRGLSGDTADLLSPVMFVLWQATAETDSMSGPLSFGIRLSGPNGGTTRMGASKEGVTFEPGDVDDLPLVIDFDPTDLVLTAYGRIRGGTERGDAGIANRFYSLIYKI